MSICVSGQLHVFAANVEHPTINDFSQEIEFANVVCNELAHFTQINTKSVVCDNSGLFCQLTHLVCVCFVTQSIFVCLCLSVCVCVCPSISTCVSVRLCSWNHQFIQSALMMTWLRIPSFQLFTRRLRLKSCSLIGQITFANSPTGFVSYFSLQAGKTARIAFCLISSSIVCSWQASVGQDERITDQISLCLIHWCPLKLCNLGKLKRNHAAKM